ncbi:MAG: hypothetical protein KDK78_01725 [Chlamydiia bacterium]|nr:hypothetical protein [Chlamydiia bacterium]
MKTIIEQAIEKWPSAYIPSYALRPLVQRDGAAYHSAVKRALSAGLLVQIRKGLYAIQGRLPHPYEVAQELHGPSFISLESALSYHGWIPEAVYTTTSACIERSMEIRTSIGIFAYEAVPVEAFYLGVRRIEGASTFLMASPWRALADVIHRQKRQWPDLAAMRTDLRVDLEVILESDLGILDGLCCAYPNRRVRETLKRLARSLGR